MLPCSVSQAVHFFGLKIIEHERAGILRERSQIAAIGRNTRAEKTFASRGTREHLRLEIQISMCRGRKVRSLGENQLAAIGRPIEVHASHDLPEMHPPKGRLRKTPTAPSKSSRPESFDIRCSCRRATRPAYGLRGRICKLQSFRSVDAATPQITLRNGNVGDPLAIPRISQIRCGNSRHEWNKLLRLGIVANELSARLGDVDE